MGVPTAIKARKGTEGQGREGAGTGGKGAIVLPMVDVAVIGAGPAGAVAARQLAQHGLEVALIEKQVLPRYKTCGGGIVERAWRLAQPVEAPSVEINQIDVWLRGQRLCRVQRQGPVLRTVMRADFDRALVTSAQLAGARLYCPCSLLSLRRRSDRIVLETSTAELEARFVIAADGTAGPTAKLGGWAPGLAIPALEAEVGMAPGQLGNGESSQPVARFDLRSPRLGYSWVFPKRAHMSIGVLATRKPYPPLKAALVQYLDALGIPRGVSTEVHGFRIPVRPRPRPARGRVLLTGDAAGFVDPVTFEGISHALLSGRLAAQAIVEGRLVGGAVERGYLALLQDQVLPELRAGRRLARLFYANAAWVERWMPRLLPRAAEYMTDIFTGDLTMSAVWRRLLSLSWLRHLRAAPVHREPTGGPRSSETTSKVE